MKLKTILSLSLALTLPRAFALDGHGLIQATANANLELSYSIEKELFQAYQVESHEGEAHVAIKANDAIYEFDCHHHGNEIACHEHDHKTSLNKKELGESGLDFLQEGEAAALEKLSFVLQRGGTSLAALTHYKVWSTPGTGDHKSQSFDIWIKAIYQLNNKERTVFIQCHEHGHKSGELACHFATRGHGEPNLED